MDEINETIIDITEQEIIKLEHQEEPAEAAAGEEMNKETIKAAVEEKVSTFSDEDIAQILGIIGSMFANIRKAANKEQFIADYTDSCMRVFILCGVNEELQKMSFRKMPEWMKYLVAVVAVVGFGLVTDKGDTAAPSEAVVE